MKTQINYLNCLPVIVLNQFYNITVDSEITLQGIMGSDTIKILNEYFDLSNDLWKLKANNMLECKTKAEFENDTLTVRIVLS